MKSAMVSRQGSTSRLQGPRSLRSADGSPRKRTPKSVKFDKTDEVIQYTTATPDVSEDNWDQISLENCENCESDTDNRPLPTLPPFSLPGDPNGKSASRSTLTREERLMQLPQFQAKLGAPLGVSDDDFDFGPELPSPSSSPQPAKYTPLAESALGSKHPKEIQQQFGKLIQESLPPYHQADPIDQRSQDAAAAAAATTTTTTQTNESGPKIQDESGDRKLLPSPLQTGMSPIIDHPPMELRMDAIMGQRSGLSPALSGGGSWHHRTGSQMSDFSDGGNEAFFPVRQIKSRNSDEDEEEYEPAEWRGEKGSVLARQDSLQDDQRHPPTQQVSTAPPPPPSTVTRTYSKRKRQLQQMLDPHGAGPAQSTGFNAIMEEDEGEHNQADLHVDVGDDSYWQGIKNQQVEAQDRPQEQAKEKDTQKDTQKLPQTLPHEQDITHKVSEKPAEQPHVSAYLHSQEVPEVPEVTNSSYKPAAASQSLQEEPTYDESHLGNVSEANQSIGISKEPAAQFAAGLSPDLRDPDEDTLQELDAYQIPEKEPESQLHLDLYSESDLNKSQQQDKKQQDQQQNRQSEPTLYLKHPSNSGSSLTAQDKSSDYSQEQSRQLSILGATGWKEYEDDHSGESDTSLRGRTETSSVEPLKTVHASIDSSQVDIDASRITYYDSEDLDRAKLEGNDSEWDRSIKPTEVEPVPESIEDSVAEPVIEARDPVPRIDASSPKSFREGQSAPEPPQHVITTHITSPIVASTSSPKAAEKSKALNEENKGTVPSTTADKNITFPGVLPWDPSGDTTYDYLASMPTPVIPQRSPERHRRSMIADRSSHSLRPESYASFSAALNKIAKPQTEEAPNNETPTNHLTNDSAAAGKNEPRDSQAGTQTEARKAVALSQASSNSPKDNGKAVIWEPENDGDLDEDWEDEDENEDENEDTEFDTKLDSLSTDNHIKTPSAGDSPVFSLPNIPHDSQLSEDIFSGTPLAKDNVDESDAKANNASSLKSLVTGSSDHPEIESFDPEILKFISENDSSNKSNFEKEIKPEEPLEPENVQKQGKKQNKEETEEAKEEEQGEEEKSPAADLSSDSIPPPLPHSYNIRKTSNSSLRKEFSFVPSAAPTLSPVSISTSPFMKLEEEIKSQQQDLTKSAGIDEIISLPLVGVSPGLNISAPFAAKEAVKNHSASPSMATENGDNSILKDMSFNNEELAKFQRKSLIEEHNREQEEDFYDNIHHKEGHPELDSDLSDFEPESAAGPETELETETKTQTHTSDISKPIGEDNTVQPEVSELENLSYYRSGDPKRESAFSMYTAQTTLEEDDVSVGEPSFGEDMASTMQTLLSGQFPPDPTEESSTGDFSSRRHSYTLRESGSYVIATSPQRRNRGQSRAYEIFDENDEDGIARQQAPIPRNRPLPSMQSFETSSSLARPPSTISKAESSNYSLSEGPSSNSVSNSAAQAWWASNSRPRQERKPLSSIPEPEEEHVPQPFAAAPSGSAKKPEPEPEPKPETGRKLELKPESELSSARLRPSVMKPASHVPVASAALIGSPISTSTNTAPSTHMPLDGNPDGRVFSTSTYETTHIIPEEVLRPPMPPAKAVQSAGASIKSFDTMGKSIAEAQAEALEASYAPRGESREASKEAPRGPSRGGPAPVVAKSSSTTESIMKNSHKMDATFASLDRTSLSSEDSFPKGLLYVAFKGIELPTVPNGDDVLVTLCIDNGVHCITSKAMPASKFSSFKEEYRIGFMEHTPVSVILKLSIPPTSSQSSTSIKEKECGSDGSFAEIDLLPLRKTAFGSRRNSYELQGLSAWGTNKQSVVAKAKADVLYIPCVSKHERPPLTLNSVSSKIIRAKQELKNLPTRAHGVLRQYGGDVSLRSGKQRYVVLDPIAPLLVAHSIRSRRPRTLINLVKALQVTSVGDNSLEIHFQNRDALRFRANSANEFETWYKHLREAINRTDGIRPKWLDAVLYESY